MAPAWLKAVTDRLRGGGAAGRAQRDAQRRAREFRVEVHRAIGPASAAGDRAALEALMRGPANLGLADEEVELEALRGALDAIGLREAITREGLPIVVHQHKALANANERCHFLASVFLASDGSDRTGRLFLTNRRVLFLSSPLVSLSWGNVASVEAEQRDLLVASTSRGVLYRFRCNSFSDAHCGEVIARAIKTQASGAGSSLPDSNATAADVPPASR